MVEAKYDAIALWYDGTVRTGKLHTDLLLPALLSLVGDVAEQSLCDLACGQGIVARELARRGAAVTGVDLSMHLLEIARAEGPSGLAYICDDAQTLASLNDAQFDGVVCSLALMDIPDLGATVAAVHRVLRPAGWFAFSVTHPCFQTPDAMWVDGENGRVRRQVGVYFEEGFWRSTHAGGVRGQVGAYHRNGHVPEHAAGHRLCA